MRAHFVVTLFASSFLTLGIASLAHADFVIPSLEEIQSNKNSEYYCSGYAEKAVQQFAKSQSLGCGFSGLRWNNDRQGQLNWCLSVLEPFALVEDEFRDKALARCQAQKSSIDNTKNQVAVPQACKDPSNAYRAVKSIKHYFRYETTITTPVQNGLIRYDYNRDTQLDYVFLEVKDTHSRVAMCFSGQQGYRRQLTDIAFSSDSSGLGSSNYSVYVNGGTLVVNIDDFEHNAGSSYRKVTYRFDTTSGKFTIVGNEASEFGVVYDDGPYPMAPPVTPILF